MNYFIGVDPGKMGAMSIICSDGKTESIPFDEDTYTARLRWLSRMAMEPQDDDSAILAVIEKVSARPGQGTVSMFSFGMNYGFILGLFKAFSIPYELVAPQKWKKEFSCTSDKNTSIAVAKRLFPKHNFKRTELSRKDDDGIAESLLMAEYARRTHG